MSEKIAHKIKNTWRSSDIKAEEKIDFSAFLLSKRVVTGLKRAGFKRPSPVQVKSIPLGRCGVDMIIQSKSGTGKTLVFAVVALEGLSDIPHTQVLILTPTREIAYQSCSVIRAVGSAVSDLECHCYIGGTSVRADMETTKDCQIAVGTPGRIKQLIEMKALATGCIRLLVLDEADNMLHKSFLDDVNWIFNHLPLRKQVLATSATYPEALKEKLKEYMRKPALVQVSEKELALRGVTQFYYVVSDHALSNVVFQRKQKVVWELLTNVDFGQCLIFCNYITRVEAICEWLNSEGYSTAKISSSEDQQTRLETMEQLKLFQCKVLVTSDLTARGIDASNVDLVINLDLPREVETYLHRIGRAGRYGAKAISITLICDGYEEKKMGEFEIAGSFQAYPLPSSIPRDLSAWSHRRIKEAEPSTLKKTVEDIENLAFKSEHMNEEANDEVEVESEESSSEDDSFEKVELEVVSELESNGDNHTNNGSSHIPAIGVEVMAESECSNEMNTEGSDAAEITKSLAGIHGSKAVGIVTNVEVLKDTIVLQKLDDSEVISKERSATVINSDEAESSDDVEVFKTDVPHEFAIPDDPFERLIYEQEKNLEEVKQVIDTADAAWLNKMLTVDDVKKSPNLGFINPRLFRKQKATLKPKQKKDCIEVPDPADILIANVCEVGSENLEIERKLFSDFQPKSKLQGKKTSGDENVSKFLKGCFNNKHLVYLSYNSLVTKLKEGENTSTAVESSTLNDLNIGQEFSSSHVSAFENFLHKNKSDFKEKILLNVAKLKTTRETGEMKPTSIDNMNVQVIPPSKEKQNDDDIADKSVQNSAAAEYTDKAGTSVVKPVTATAQKFVNEKKVACLTKKDRNVSQKYVKDISKNSCESGMKLTEATPTKLKSLACEKLKKSSESSLSQKETNMSDVILKARNTVKRGPIQKNKFLQTKDSSKTESDGSSQRKGRNENVVKKETVKTLEKGCTDIVTNTKLKNKQEASKHHFSGSATTSTSTLVSSPRKKTEKAFKEYGIDKGNKLQVEDNFSGEISQHRSSDSKLGKNSDKVYDKKSKQSWHDESKKICYSSSDSSSQKSQRSRSYNHRKPSYHHDDTLKESKENIRSSRCHGHDERFGRHDKDEEWSEGHHRHEKDYKRYNRYEEQHKGHLRPENDHRRLCRHEELDKYDGYEKESGGYRWRDYNFKGDYGCDQNFKGDHGHNHNFKRDFGLEKDSNNHHMYEEYSGGHHRHDDYSRDHYRHEDYSRGHRHENYSRGHRHKDYSRDHRHEDYSRKPHRYEGYSRSSARWEKDSTGLHRWEEDSRGQHMHESFRDHRRDDYSRGHSKPEEEYGGYHRHEEGPSSHRRPKTSYGHHRREIYDRHHRHDEVSAKHSKFHYSSPPRSYYKTYPLPFSWPAVSQAEVSRSLRNQRPRSTAVISAHSDIEPQGYTDNPACCYNKSDRTYELMYSKPLPCASSYYDSNHSHGRELHNGFMKYLQHRKHYY